MSITVKLYQFTKRKNSTALPTAGTSSVDVSVLLKDKCSGENPVLVLESADPSGYLNYNYAYISWFGRYYFIAEREYDTGSRIILHLVEDYLGSASVDIKNISSALIEYSSMVTNNVIDNRISQTVAPTYTRTDGNLTNTVFTEDSGVIILGITGAYHNGLYILGNSAHLSQLFTTVDWDSITITQGADANETIKNVGDAVVDIATQFFTKSASMPCLRSVFQLPWVVHGDAIGAETTDLIIGSFPTGERAYKVRREVISDHVTISIPWINNNWKRCSKYTDLILYMPLFGLIKLPVDELIDDTAISVYYSFSYNNGDVAYQIMGTTSHHIVATGTTNVAAPLCMGSSNVSLGNKAGNIISAIGSVGKLATAPMNIAEELTGVSHPLAALSDALLASQQSTPMLNGGFGGSAITGLDKTFHLYQFSHNLTDTPANYASLFGYPRFSVGSLSGLSGFCKLRDYVFAGNFTSNENAKISGMLNSGFYIE